ncbi:Helix-turn-helix domain protein [Roseivivax sp. THAF40]|uniref:helix-turn-helix domain-containing protein n=1 Tax=Roseivivax sp. THAF40 TaxID=2587858 RepID=UPI001267F686|nr:helix-turn-helix transcriptional regulator [Roseivivax sp. THAF40]QFT47136.1 Helix-turn-helix domain protein [Roseivivax sp. THAF40]
MPDTDPPNPSDLRARFGANLRHLSRRAPSISALCREIGINRTQYNRYLSGESFPRPDILHRICEFFDVDARILLDPVEEIERGRHGLTLSAELQDFLGGKNVLAPPEADFPSGFYRFTRPSFVDDERFLISIVMIYRRSGQAFLRGLEAREAMRRQGLPLDRRMREFRGLVIPQFNGVAILISRRGGQTTSFNFLSRVPTFENNFWSGYTARTISETETGARFARQVYEHIGPSRANALRAARQSGLCEAADLPPFHRQQLKVGQALT